MTTESLLDQLVTEFIEAQSRGDRPDPAGYAQRTGDALGREHAELATEPLDADRRDLVAEGVAVAVEPRLTGKQTDDGGKAPLARGGGDLADDRLAQRPGHRVGRHDHNGSLAALPRLRDVDAASLDVADHSVSHASSACCRRFSWRASSSAISSGVRAARSAR